MVCVSCPVTIREEVESETSDPMQTTGLFVGETKLMDPAVKQMLEMEDAMQFVVSTSGCGFGLLGCAFPNVGVNQPENSRPRVRVAMMNKASSIGRRPASFNTFLLMLIN